MKRYIIKPEYLHLWGNDCTEQTIITEQELERLAAEWEMPEEQLVKQLIEIDEG